MSTEEPADATADLDPARWIDRRASFVESTTPLSDREAEALAHSERGYSDAGVAKQIGSAEGTATQYLDRAVARFGPSVRLPVLEPDPATDRELTRVELDDLADWPQSRREVWQTAAERHPDYAPDLDETANRRAFPELYDERDGSTTDTPEGEHD